VKVHLSYSLLLNTTKEPCILFLVKCSRIKSNLCKIYNHFRICGSIDGTLCLHQIEYDNYGRTVLYNPTTQTIKLLPASEDEFSITFDSTENYFYYFVTSRLHGFGYDHVINDYNVIRYVKVSIEPKPFLDYPDDFEETINHRFGDIVLGPLWEIYSLRSNLWRKLHVDMPFSENCTEGTQVYMDGVCHWLCEKHEDNPIGPCLVSFYLSNEVSFTTPIPSDVDDCFDVGAEWINLVVLNGSIALISYHEERTTFHVSILGQLGFKESWIKLFMVGPLPCVERLIRVGTKGEIFFIKKDKEIAWFDLSKQMIEELGYTA
jgi:F-box interacting protein